MKNTRFICFYSYKGGTGRSLTLANIAYLLATQGNKVLIMDMDMEAPGQHMTDLFHEEHPIPKSGLLELLLARKHCLDQKKPFFL
jgi:cellulose biosynthesis protein BcsQ